MPAVLKGDSMKKSLMALTLCALMSGSTIFAADQTPRDNFYWLGQINKASDIINTDEGLLTPAEGKNIAHGIEKVLDEGNKPGGPRPTNVVAFEPYLIQAAGPEVTKIHAGRSSQDMLTTVGIMEQREHLMAMAKELCPAKQPGSPPHRLCQCIQPRHAACQRILCPPQSLPDGLHGPERHRLAA